MEGDVASETISKCAEVFERVVGNKEAALWLARQLWKGAVAGLEVDESSPESCRKWFDERFSYQLVRLDKNDYATALVRALWLAPRFAPTDFGGARQRDFAQLWADTARGFLGEIALQKFLESRLDLKIRLEVRRGELEEFLASDIDVLDRNTGQFRKPRKPVSIKTAKFNGRWLDLPGAQFHHSEVFVLVKLGISRLHFSAFLKDISFLRDKLFALAKELGELNNSREQELWGEIPDFTPIPAYIAGFIEKEEVRQPIHEIRIKPRYEGRTRRLKRIEIVSGVGLFSASTVRSHPEVRRLDPQGEATIAVDPIIKSLGEGKHFLAHSGALKYGKEVWSSLVALL